ncbi:MAG: Holliday junction DNA helicase RuvA [Deltaproteobacteria bacterium]|nr:Holliday junction DNA helicase RuvA [Deltaproteobacteria bacterium]
MIRYIKGTLFKAEDGYIVVVAGGVGYEILLPEIVWQEFTGKRVGEEVVELFISYHQTAQQPKPVLIGFTTEIALEFFEHLITVKDIGPSTAARALTLPVPIIARAIEDRDVQTITKLKGVGRRKADMMISELNGKVGKYALMREDERPFVMPSGDFSKQVIDVLVKQLGHNRSEAARMVEEALKRKPDAQTPEELFEEVYRGTKQP